MIKLAALQVHLAVLQFLNPHPLEQRFWSLPSFCFHWDTTHAASSLLGLGVRFLEHLLCFKRATQGDGFDHPFGTALGEQLDFADRLEVQRCFARVD
jgi:hypothetical protein